MQSNGGFIILSSQVPPPTHGPCLFIRLFAPLTAGRIVTSSTVFNGWFTHRCLRNWADVTYGKTRYALYARDMVRIQWSGLTGKNHSSAEGEAEHSTLLFEYTCILDTT